MTQTQKAKYLLEEGKEKECFAILKTFRMGLTKEEKSTVVRYYEMLVDPSFYNQLGYRLEEERNRALPIANKILYVQDQA